MPTGTTLSINKYYNTTMLCVSMTSSPNANNKPNIYIYISYSTQAGTSRRGNIIKCLFSQSNIYLQVNRLVQQPTVNMYDRAPHPSGNPLDATHRYAQMVDTSKSRRLNEIRPRASLGGLTEDLCFLAPQRGHMPGSTSRGTAGLGTSLVWPPFRAPSPS